MLDLFNLPNNSNNFNKQVFYSSSNASVLDTSISQVWVKPRNVKFVNIFVLGSGGGGGGGVTGVAGSTRTGGGGGGSSSVANGLFQANLIPDILYIRVAKGGFGGAPGESAGGDGDISYVSVTSNISDAHILLRSGDTAATGGRSGAGGGTAGAGGVAFAGSLFNNLGLVTVFNGQAGTAGTTSSVTNRAISGITTGGAGGAGTATANVSAGGSIIGAGFIPTISGGTVSGGTGGNGFTSGIPYNNLTTRTPMIFTGGAGGGSSNAIPGGNGGNASYGSGGGGGAGGTTGGSGGRGGDGLVIITSW